MFSRSKITSSSRVLFHVFFFAASILASSSFSAPATAQTPGLNGFALCASKAPKEGGYVEGNPVYFSEVFQVYAGNADWERAYATFLKQKYNFSGPLHCSVAYAKDDQLKEFNRELEVAGSLAVRTGWTFANGGTAPAPATAPAAAAQNNAAPVASTYFVCTWPTSAAGVLTYYVSDVNGVPAGVDAGPFLGQLAPAFGNFITAKYHPAGGAYNCVYQFSQADAEALKKRDLTTAAPKGYKPVDASWKYGGTAVPAAVASPASSPQTVAATASPAPNQPSAPPAPAAVAVAQPVAPVTANITFRLVDAIDSGKDPAGRQYRAVVTQAATAGTVTIAPPAMGQVILVQNGNGWMAQLTSLAINGQVTAVTSSSVTAANPTQDAVKKIGGLIGGFGGNRVNQATAAVSAVGSRVLLPPGTSLTFTAPIPQPSAPAPTTTTAAPVAASTASQGNVAAPQTGGGPVGLCEQLVGSPSPGVQKRYYISAIFDVPNDNDKAKWDVAWGYYIQGRDNFSAYSNGGGCTFYRTRAGAEQILQSRKNNLAGAKLIETGWVYTGPEQLPPPTPPNPGHGK